MPNSRVLAFRGPQAASRATRALGLLVVTALVALAVLSTLQLRTQAETAARKSAEDAAYALAMHASQIFAAADSIAVDVARGIARARTTSAGELEEEFGTLDEHELLRARQSSFEGIDAVSVVGASGRLINTSLTYPPPAMDLSGAEGFLFAKDARTNTVHIAAPVKNPIGAEWTIYLSRRLSNEEGQFLGVVLVGVSSPYLSAFYAKMRPEPTQARSDATAITLLRRDGSVLARSPRNEQALGRIISGVGHYRALIDARHDRQAGGPFTPWDAKPDEDGCVVLAARDAEGFPLTVGVAVHEDFYLTAWRGQAEYVAAFSAIAVMFLAGTFVTLVRMLRRREQHLQEVEQLRVAAEKASQAKTNFLATVSHEVRTPLNGILGTAELLVRSGLPPKQEELASTLLVSGRNLLSIITDILDLSKIEADELVVEAAPFSPWRVVHDVLGLFASYASSKGLGLSMHADNQVPAVLAGDSHRVKQVVGNLVSNAIKFSDTGEVRVTLSWPLGDDGTQVLRIEVSDTGVGVPEEARERIFQPFGQADGSISRRFGGTGLGLAISKRLVDLMGGTIDFTSRPAAGATFWVELPLPETAEPVPEDAHQEHSDWTFAHSGPMPLGLAATGQVNERRGAHVLVVEDNAINAMVVEAQLQRLGCGCDIATDGEEALQRLSTGHYSLVLMDCMLPGISGFETTQRWRALEAKRGLKHLPIVALTANALASNLAETRTAGMDDFLTKPCTLDKLEAVLRTWLAPPGKTAATPQTSEPVDQPLPRSL